MKAVKWFAVAAVVAAVVAPAAYAEAFKAPTLSGQVFVYYRYDMTDQEEASSEGANEFDLSRCYLNVKGAVFEKLNYRVTGDVYRPTTYEYDLVQDPDTGEYTLEPTSSKGSLAFRVKYAYIDVTDVIPNHSIFAGVEKTPWADFEQDIWGWRVLRKVAWDNWGYGPSADLGFGVGGVLFNGLLTHHLTYTNGPGYDLPENGLSGKDVTYRVSAYPLVNDETWGGVSVSAVVKAGNLGEKVGPNQAKNPVTAYGGLLGAQHPYFNFGAGYFMQTSGEDNATLGSEKVTGNIMTAYATGHFRVTEGMTVHPLVRYDAFEPNKDQSDDEETLMIGGVGVKFFDDKLALIPNYQKEGFKEVNADNGNMENKSNDYVYLHCQWDWE